MSILANTTLIMRMGITALADVGSCRIALWFRWIMSRFVIVVNVIGAVFQFKLRFQILIVTRT